MVSFHVSRGVHPVGLPSVQEGTVGVPPRVALCLTKAGETRPGFGFAGVDFWRRDDETYIYICIHRHL